jgi:hypothetical protein
MVIPPLRYASFYWRNEYLFNNNELDIPYYNYINWLEKKQNQMVNISQHGQVSEAIRLNKST